MKDTNKIIITVEIKSSNPEPKQVIEIAHRQLELAFGDQMTIKCTEIQPS